MLASISSTPTKPPIDQILTSARSSAMISPGSTCTRRHTGDDLFSHSQNQTTASTHEAMENPHDEAGEWYESSSEYPRHLGFRATHQHNRSLPLLSMDSEIPVFDNESSSAFLDSLVSSSKDSDYQKLYDAMLLSPISGDGIRPVTFTSPPLASNYTTHDDGRTPQISSQPTSASKEKGSARTVSRVLLRNINISSSFH